MPVTLQTSGTQSATLTTLHTLADISVAGAFSFHISLLNMEAGDHLEIYISQIMLTGDSREGNIFEQFDGAQPTNKLHWVSEILGNDLTDSGSIRFAIKQTVGTGRSYKWKVLKYA